MPEMNTQIFRRRCLIALPISLAAGLLISLDAMRRPGYFAGYSFMLAIVIAITVAAGALVLLAFQRTRPFSGAVLLSALLLVATTYGTMRVMATLGAFRTEIVRLPDANLPADFVFVLAPHRGFGGATTQLLQSLQGSYMTILAVDVGGYHGYAVHLDRSTTVEERTQFKKRLLESPVVWKVFENVVPSQVNLK